MLLTSGPPVHVQGHLVQITKECEDSAVFYATLKSGGRVVTSFIKILPVLSRCFKTHQQAVNPVLKQFQVSSFRWNGYSVCTCRPNRKRHLHGVLKMNSMVWAGKHSNPPAHLCSRQSGKGQEDGCHCTLRQKESGNASIQGKSIDVSWREIWRQ